MLSHNIYIEALFTYYMKVIFVCNQGQHRSKTAEEIFKDRFKTKSAGLFSVHPLTEEDLIWADNVVVMEDFQREEIGKRFPNLYLKKTIISFDIPDMFHYQQPELIKRLKEKAEKLL